MNTRNTSLPYPVAKVDQTNLPLRILLVDDHAPTRLAIATLLRNLTPPMDVVGTADNATSALYAQQECCPDVVVLDVDLGQVNGIDFLSRLVTIHPSTVIVLSANEDPLVRRQALAAGARSFISKLAPAGALIAAIRDAGRTIVTSDGDKAPEKIG